MSHLLHAPAKLNLFLEVTGKREDGYHTLSTLSAFTQFGDVIHLSERNTDSLTITGEFSENAGTENNLVTKALDLCRAELGITQHYSVVLEKNIPVGAGLGGGSSDAACIVKHFISDEKTAKKICSQLGADVFMCWLSRPAMLGGIGDELIRFEDVPPYHVVLVNPRKLLSTLEVFKKLPSLPQRSELHGRQNDLTETAISIVPEISGILSLLEKQQGCILARMSGSGATCFALFDDEQTATNCNNIVRRTFPDYWSIVTQIKKAA